MTLATGSRLGSYEILAPLGAGGMGEVWRAHDTKLGRDVALKVLPQSLAQDAERLARFEREAHLLASLNHPHIAAIYGVEDSTATKALVLELVEGPTLQDRIDQGPLPVDEVVAIARQIADALSAAHERGIVHRDLKPANVKLTADGTVKVLDFGLAKALDAPAGTVASLHSPTLMRHEGEPQARASAGLPGPAAGPGLANSPTLTAAGTQMGVILGTAAYMAPEQARGRAVDRRADVWAWGCVVSEMLSGRRPFAGEEISDTLASILKSDPDWRTLPTAAGEATHRVLRRCLEKDPARRYRDATDAALELESALAEDARSASSAGAAAPARARLPWIIAGACGLAALLLGVAWLRRGEFPAAEPESRLEVGLPQGRGLALEDVPNLALSADGRLLALQTKEESPGTSHLELRPLDRLETIRLDGTEGASSPFFSPDGRWIGFFAGGKLQKIPVGGGAATTLADASTHRGADWAADGSIIYSPTFAGGLFRLPSAGGTPASLAEPRREQGERTYRWPDALPNGKGVLFTIGWLRSPQAYDDADIAVRVEATGEIRTLVKGGNMARFMPPDRLIFLRAGKLYAAPFDEDSLTLGGEPAPVLQEVGGEPTSGAGYFAVAGNGTLAWVPSSMTALRTHLTLVDRQGQGERLQLPVQGYNMPHFSPDGSRLVFNAGPGRLPGLAGDVWLVSLADSQLERLTFDGFSAAPIFSPDGRTVAYSLATGEHQGIYLRRVDGGAPPRLLIEEAGSMPTSWSPDGRLITYTTTVPEVALHLVEVETGKARVFEPHAAAGQFSPDGRFLAYMGSDQDVNVYVRPLAGEGKWQITPSGGSYPTWPRSGNEVLFVQAAQMWSVAVATEPTFRAAAARRLFGGLERYNFRTNPILNLAVSPDGRRFAFSEFENAATIGRGVAVALHWGDAQRRAATP